MQLAILTALGVGGATIFGVLLGFLFQKIRILSRIWVRGTEPASV